MAALWMGRRMEVRMNMRKYLLCCGAMAVCVIAVCVLCVVIFSGEKSGAAGNGSGAGAEAAEGDMAAAGASNAEGGVAGIASGAAGANGGTGAGNGAAGTNGGTEAGSGTAGTNSGTGAGNGATGANGGTGAGNGAAGASNGKGTGNGAAGTNGGTEAGSGTGAGNGAAGANGGTGAGSGAAGTNGGTGAGNGVTGANGGKGTGNGAAGTNGGTGAGGNSGAGTPGKGAGQGNAADSAMPGPLSLAGTQLTDSGGNPVQLRGISTHGLAWYPDYVNEACIRQFREDWGMNVIRLALYTAESGGYCTGGDKEGLKSLVKNGVEYATACGMYVIIDWHILSDGNPNTYIKEAKAFFQEMSQEYADYTNVIYEICNEPNGGTSWSQVKSYAEEVISVIRENDEDGIILVGTPNWCQYVDQAAADPIMGYENIMYTLHFYAATHTDSLRKAMVNAVEAGLPIFVSEYGICDASGNGAIDENQADKWVETMNEHGISYVAWNLSNKSETSAILKSSCGKVSGFAGEDLSDSGRWLYGMLEEVGVAGTLAGGENAGTGNGTGGSGTGSGTGGSGTGNGNGTGGSGAGNGGNGSSVGTGNGTSGSVAGTGNGTSGSVAGTGNGTGGSGAGTGNGGNGSGTGTGTSGTGAGAGNGASGTSTSDGIEAGGLMVTAKVVTSWESGGATYFQYDLTLSNETDTGQNGWTIRLTFSSNITLQNGWNGNYEVDGNVLTISSMDYNAQIEKGGSTGDVGFVVQTDADCTLGN